MKKQITLRSYKELLAFFKAHPELSFEQMNNIVHKYAGGQFTAVVFTSNKNKAQDGDERPKRELMDWLEKNGEALDKGEAAHFFTSTFPKRETI